MDVVCISTSFIPSTGCSAHQTRHNITFRIRHFHRAYLQNDHFNDLFFTFAFCAFRQLKAEQPQETISQM